MPPNRVNSLFIFKNVCYKSGTLNRNLRVSMFGSIQGKILVTPSERLTENNCDYMILCSAKLLLSLYNKNVWFYQLRLLEFDLQQIRRYILGVFSQILYHYTALHGL